MKRNKGGKWESGEMKSGGEGKEQGREGMCLPYKLHLHKSKING